MSGGAVLIEAVQLTKAFKNHSVLNRLDLQVRRGETLVIIGRSGCGKSVFLKHAIGLIRPDKGRMLVDGVDLSALSGKKMDALRLRFGMLFQGSALFDSMTVGENVGFGLAEHAKLGERERAARVDESLELVGLRGIRQMRPSELSGGMKKRVALARAICMRPEILLYDEPTTGLDPVTSSAINELIVSLRDKLRVTSIVVTHDMATVFRVATRVAMMHQGRITQTGGPDQIRNSSDPVVRQFITGSAEGPMTEVNFKSL